MDEDDAEVEYESIVPRRWRWSDLSVIGLQFAQAVLADSADAVCTLKECIAGHINYTVDREKLAEQAGLEIEMLTQGVE